MVIGISGNVTVPRGLYALPSAGQVAGAAAELPEGALTLGVPLGRAYRMKRLVERLAYDWPGQAILSDTVH